MNNFRHGIMQQGLAYLNFENSFWYFHFSPKDFSRYLKFKYSMKVCNGDLNIDIEQLVPQQDVFIQWPSVIQKPNLENVSDS